MKARRVLVVAAATLAATVAMIPAANAAPRPFGPPVTVAGCLGVGDGVTGVDGSYRGFVGCGEFPGPPIRFVSRTAAGVVNPSVNSGLSGVVLDVATDATATYVLFYRANLISVGKRTNDGEFSSRVVDTWSGITRPTGSIIARDGQWFGVWSKPVGSSVTADLELYQGGTGASTVRITNKPAVADVQPRLVYFGTVPTMVWARVSTPGRPTSSDLWVSSYRSGGWNSRLFASAGTFNSDPDITVGSGTTYITWVRDGRIVVAGNSTNVFVSHTFNTGGRAPKVAVSVSGVVDHVFVAWTTTTSRVFFAETTNPDGVTGYQGEVVAGEVNSFLLGPWALGGYGGKATISYTEDYQSRLLTQS